MRLGGKSFCARARAWVLPLIRAGVTVSGVSPVIGGLPLLPELFLRALVSSISV